MARRKAVATVPKAPPPCLDVARFTTRPNLKNSKARSTPGQRDAAWRSFRMVMIATRTLRYFGLAINSRSVAAATRLLARHSDVLEQCFHSQGRRDLKVVPVSEKTVLQNEMCACVLATFTTSSPVIRSRARPLGHIPKGWRNQSRTWLMERLAEVTADRDDYKRKYKAAVQAQVPEPEEDSFLVRLKQYAEVAAAAKGITLPN